MKHKNLKLKMGEEQVEILHELYAYQLTSWQPEGEHEMLLREHLTGFFEKLSNELKKNNIWRCIYLSRAEALAFHQFWKCTDTSAWDYGAAIINNILDRVDKRSKMAFR